MFSNPSTLKRVTAQAKDDLAHILLKIEWEKYMSLTISPMIGVANQPKRTVRKLTHQNRIVEAYILNNFGPDCLIINSRPNFLKIADILIFPPSQKDQAHKYDIISRMNNQELVQKIISGGFINQSQARDLIRTPDKDLFSLLASADIIRQYFKGNKIKLCAIVNAKSGRCSENCVFCAQSGHNKTAVNVYPLLSAEEMASAARAAEKTMSATCFSIVTSGKSIYSDSEIDSISSALMTITQETGLNRCVSLGTLNREQIQKLKTSGLKRLHHNLETAESYFDKICTTHSYQERLNTIKFAKLAGLEICSGGIFGLGETPEQRVELAFALKELEVDSVPINILNPIPGTPAAEKNEPMSPFDVLRLVATYRFILPDKDIGVFGGRERSLGSLQPLMFIAGANVTLIGDYLTTTGESPDKDLQMIKDLGLETEGQINNNDAG